MEHKYAETYLGTMASQESPICKRSNFSPRRQGESDLEHTGPVEEMFFSTDRLLDGPTLGDVLDTHTPHTHTLTHHHHHYTEKIWQHLSE